MYTAHLDGAKTLQDQLRLVDMLRDMASKVAPPEGIAKIHDLLTQEFGDHGPLMLGQIGVPQS